MEQQKQRIAEFLDGIIDSSLPAEQQIMLFSEEEGVEGAGAQNGNCKNYTVGECGTSVNRECTNYNSTCGSSDNTRCTSMNDATCKTLDPSTATCGGQGGDS